jgi:nucleoside-diphosphate-sugar epimerase
VTSQNNGRPRDPANGRPRDPGDAATNRRFDPSANGRPAPGGDGRRRVLVTGGLGFIGSFLSEALSARGDAVTIVDSGVSSVVELAELDPGAGSLDHVEASVERYLAERGSLNGFDLVVHCASYVGPAMLLDYGGRIAPAIVGATASLIERCLAAGVPIVDFSSAEVYGYSGVLREDAAVRVPPHYSPRIEYAVAKLACEAMCVNAAERGLRSAVIRPFNVAGPRQSRFGGFVLPTFVQQALAGEPLTVFAGGQQKRAFLAVDDLCRFITEHLDERALAEPRIFNVGNPRNAVEIHELAVRVRTFLRSESEIVFTDGALVHGPSYEEAESIEKLPHVRNAGELGWSPRVGLDELIERTVAYYRSRGDRRYSSNTRRVSEGPSTSRSAPSGVA